MMIEDRIINEDSFKNELEKIGEKYKAVDYNSAKRILNMEFIAGADIKNIQISN